MKSDSFKDHEEKKIAPGAKFEGAFSVITYLTNRVYEDLVFCLMQFYHKNCLVSSCLSTEQWRLSLQSYITES